MRIAVGLEYNGAAFHGWQTQRGQRTVQPLVEQALAAVADHPVSVVCAGRTDSGVHAAQQVVHFDTEAVRSSRSWVLGANTRLPGDVALLWAVPVSEEFHARFRATARSYDYVICVRQARPGLWHRQVTWECRGLDGERMRHAAAALVGEHDFSSFRARGCQARHPVRTVTGLEVLDEAGFIVLRVTANAFLQHMVRNIAGVLMEIGRGRRPPSWAGEVLAARRRECGGVTAPPDGLYLTAVSYPAAFGLPSPVPQVPLLSCYTGAAFGPGAGRDTADAADGGAAVG